MREALGLVETIGLSNAILVADAMSKTANIKIIGLENSKGLGYMTIKITGDVGAVNAAVACGKQIAIENNSFVTAKVIPRPASNIEVSFCQPNKENTSIEKDDNKENIIEANNHSNLKEESELSINHIETATEIENDKEEEAVVKVEEADKTKEVTGDLSGIEEEDLSIEKSKPKRNTRKRT